MINNTFGSLSSINYWNAKWQDIFDNYQQDTRHAYYIHSLLNDGEDKILEIAAGSFRDTATLNALGKETYAFDFSEQAVAKAKKINREYSSRYSCQSAFETNFSDKEFDFSFSNGFWGCFDDNKIVKLAAEQKRITKKRMAVTVHNRHNNDFVEYFKRKQKEDNLFSVRFFTINEITEIMRKFTNDIVVIPVGKSKKYHEDKMIMSGNYDKARLLEMFKAHGHNHLNTSERLLAIGVV